MTSLTYFAWMVEYRPMSANLMHCTRRVKLTFLERLVVFDLQASVKQDRMK